MSAIKNEHHLPWKIVVNWNGKLAIVDARNKRVCNLPQDKGRGRRVAEAILWAMENTWSVE